MESLCYSANKGSEDAYDVSTSLTTAEQQLVRFNASRGKLKTVNECPKLLLDSRVLRAKCSGCINPKEPLVQSEPCFRVGGRF